MNFVIKSMIVQHHLQLISVKYLHATCFGGERKCILINPRSKGKDEDYVRAFIVLPSGDNHHKLFLF